MRRLIFIGWCLCAAVAAQAPGSVGPVGTVRTIDGHSITGAVTVDSSGKVTITATGATIISGNEVEPVELALEEITTFEIADPKEVASSPPHRVWLRSGLEIGATELRGIPAGEGKPARLAAKLAVGVTLELPISTIRAIRHGGNRQGGAERAQPASFEDDLGDAPDNTDLLYVQKDGKQHRFQVAVKGMQADMVDFDLRGQAHDYVLDGVVGIVFGNNTGFAADPQKPPRTAIHFDTGDHLEGRLMGLGATVNLRLDEGCEVSVPSSRIVRIAIASDRLKWLSDLEPEVEQTPAFDRIWPWTRDRSVAGPGFVLGGRTFARGIGMVPKTRLTYDLGGKYDAFEAMIGIDDRGGPQAHAVFRVLLDGVVAYESSPRTRGQAAEAVRVELQKCQRLAIEVDFGKNYDLGDYCVFADARVLRL